MKGNLTLPLPLALLREFMTLKLQKNLNLIFIQILLETLN